MSASGVRRAARALLWVVVSLAMLALCLLLAALLAFRSGWGQRQILARLLPLAQRELAGELSVGGLEGDLVRTLALRDIVLRDAGGEVAVRVRRFAVSYDLPALLRKTVRLTEVDINGAFIHARYLPDGRLNLAALLREGPAAAPAGPAPPQEDGLIIQIEQVRARGEARYEPPPGQALPGDGEAAGTFTLAGKGTVRPAAGEILATVRELLIDVRRPLLLDARFSGGFRQRDEGRAIEQAELLVRTTGAELRRLLPVPLQGAFSLSARAHGPLDGLAVEAALRPPEGRIAATGQVGLGAVGALRPSWRVRVSGEGVDPGAAWAGLPRGEIALQAGGEGEGERGAVQLDRLQVTLPRARARASASGRFTLDGQGEARLQLSAADLAAFVPAVLAAAPGTGPRDAPRLAGAVDLGLRLWRRRERLGGEAQLQARALRAGPVRLDRLAIEARGTENELLVRGDGQGPEGTSFQLLVTGSPIRGAGERAGETIGADLTLQTLRLARAGVDIRARGPARIRVAEEVLVRDLVLTSGAQRLALPLLRYVPDRQRFTVVLDAEGLDLRALGRLVEAEAPIPSTRLDLHARAGGTPRAPSGTVRLQGVSSALPALRLPRLSHALRLEVRRGRAEGAAEVRAPEEQAQLAADFSVPLAPRGALSLDLRAAVPLERARPFLPPQLKDLKGAARLRAQAGGTLAAPTLAMRLELPGLRSTTLRAPEAEVEVRYAEARLSATVTAAVAVTVTDPGQKAAGKPAGALRASVEAPLRLGLPPGKDLERGIGAILAEVRAAVARGLPVRGSVRLSAVQLGALGQALLAEPPLRAGTLEASADLGGTLLEPSLLFDASARGLATSEAAGGVDQADLSVGLRYLHGEVAVDARAALRGAPILLAHGETALPFARLLRDPDAWRRAPVRGLATVPPYALARLSKDAAGTLRGQATVGGTAVALQVEAQLMGEGMRYQRWQIGDLRASGAYAPESGLVAQVEGAQQRGGQLDLRVRVPRRAAPRADLVARGYVIDYEPGALAQGALRVLRGTLQADLHLAEEGGRPSLYGDLGLRQGAIGLSADPRIYRAINVDLRIDRDGQVRLRELTAQAETGSLRAEATAQLRGLTPISLDGSLRTQRFPISSGALGVWLDTEVALRGRAQGEQLRASVTVQRGTAHLPRISTGKKLQSLAPLEDVVYVDPRGLAAVERRRAEREGAAEERTSPPLADLPTQAVLRVRIPGPFYLRSSEVSATAEGDLRIALHGSQVAITGAARVTGGWIDLLGRRYEIDRAVVSFSGGPEIDPELDVRIFRRLQEARVVIEVRGTATRPKIALRSEPPIYSESQILGIILTGDPSDQRASEQTLDQRALGLLSSLLVGQLRDVVARHLPFDVFKVDVGGEGYNVFGQTRIEVGKYLMDNLYVSYSYQFGQRSGTRRVNANQIRVDYRFLGSFVVQTIFGDAGVGAIDLYWSRRF